MVDYPFITQASLIKTTAKNFWFQAETDTTIDILLQEIYTM
jgi:hypothetical protein